MVRASLLGLGIALTLCASAWGRPVQSAPAPLLAAGIPAFAAVAAAALGARFLRRDRNATKE